MTAPLHGWLIIDKPRGLGSTQAVGLVKRLLRQSGEAKTKVGHGGTLDPLAEGVLPIALGEATKLAGRMLDSDKIYDFTIRFGEQTDTLDMEGPVIATSDVRPTLVQVAAVLPRFTGPIEQAPPMYSAILIEGKRAYDLARAGETVEMKLRGVTIHALMVNSSPAQGEEPAKLVEGLARSAVCDVAPSTTGYVGGPPPRAGEELESITLTAHVSKGTYIRSLARDIAIALGTVGHVTMLARQKAGPFGRSAAISLDKLEDAANQRAIGSLVLPLTTGLDDIPALPVNPDQALALRQGRILDGSRVATGLHLAIDGDIPVALVEATDSDIGVREIRVVRGFNLVSKEED